MRKTSLLPLLFLCHTLLMASSTYAAQEEANAPQDILVCQTDKAKYQYRIALANLLLEKTRDLYGPARIAPFNMSSTDPTQSRCELLLLSQQVHLLYLPVTAERMERFDAVKIDIHNGMLGHRVLVIREQDQAQFSKVKTLDDLREYTGGFGEQWGDFKLFALNDLPVFGVVETKNLYGMLSAGRFDYFHRGLHEAWQEVNEMKHLYPDLKVEEKLAIAYDFPVYYMVHPENQTLKQRLLAGFDIIKSDGSYRQLFLQFFGHLAEKAALEERLILRIDYPLPEGLPEIDTSIWLSQ